MEIKCLNTQNDRRAIQTQGQIQIQTFSFIIRVVRTMVIRVVTKRTLTLFDHHTMISRSILSYLSSFKYSNHIVQNNFIIETNIDSEYKRSPGKL